MDIIMPQLGETVAEGVLSKWHKKAGESVALGEVLFEIETDKTSMEIEATKEGKLLKIMVNEGETVVVGTVLAILLTDNEDEDTVIKNIDAKNETADEVLEEKIEDTGNMENTSVNKEDASVQLNIQSDGVFSLDPPSWFEPFCEVLTPLEKYIKIDNESGFRFTPLAKRILSNNDINIAQVIEYFKTTGIKKIAKIQVEEFQSRAPQESRNKPINQNTIKVDRSIYTEIDPLNRIRRTTAERLSNSWPNIPQAFQAVEVIFGNVDHARKHLKEKNKDNKDFKISYLSFVARAVCIAIKSYPRVNSYFDNKQLLLSETVNLGIAIDLNYKGLLVPVIKDAQKMNIIELNDSLNDLVNRAQSGNLKQEEYIGGTYTISNNGSMGTYLTAPIINPPQVAILSFDGVNKKPVVIEDADHGDTIAIRRSGIIGQSFDHRAFDGAYAASFLKEVNNIIENYDWLNEIN